MPERAPDAAIARSGLSRDDVLAAGRRLAGRVIRTPVIRSEDLDRVAGGRLWLKAENLQRGGSFKVRGATLAVDRLAAGPCPGLVAHSTGNHAIAVALAAHSRGLPAVLVLPVDAAGAKVARIRALGAEVLLVGTTVAERVSAVARLHERLGYAVVDPYQDPDVVAGQGSAGAELLGQLHDLGERIDTVVVPVGGGSALAGACLAAEGSGVQVVAAEPAAVPALSLALREGRPVTVPAGPTLADGLRPDRIGDLPFDLVRDRVAAVRTVEEEDVAAALYLALMHARLLIEPASATALAVALALTAERNAVGRDPAQAGIGVLITGGNVEAALVADLMVRRGGPGAVAA